MRSAGRAVPRLQGDALADGEEHDHWVDLPEDLAAHLMVVSQRIGRAIDAVWRPARVGQMIQGFEVPHTHIHVFPANDMSGYTLSTAMRHDETDAEKMDAAAETIREGLKAQEAK